MVRRSAWKRASIAACQSGNEFPSHRRQRRDAFFDAAVGVGRNDFEHRQLSVADLPQNGRRCSERNAALADGIVAIGRMTGVRQVHQSKAWRRLTQALEDILMHVMRIRQIVDDADVGRTVALDGGEQFVDLRQEGEGHVLDVDAHP